MKHPAHEASPSHEGRALLEAARGRRMSAASQKRALLALGLGSATALTPAVAAGLMKWAKTGSVAVVAAKWGTGVGAAVVIASLATAPWRGPDPEQGASASVTKTSPTIALAPGSSRAEPTAPMARPVAEPEPVASANPLPGPVPSMTKSELSLLDSARFLLRAGKATQALSVLSERSRLYPKGSLGLEARVLRIEALAASGRGAQARSEAEQFLREQPNGLMSHRVRRWLEREGAR